MAKYFPFFVVCALLLGCNSYSPPATSEIDEQITVKADEYGVAKVYVENASRPDLVSVEAWRVLYNPDGTQHSIHRVYDLSVWGEIYVLARTDPFAYVRFYVTYL